MLEHITEDETIVVSGENPLENCPKDWNEAKIWINEYEKYYQDEWSFDCGFKLDFDGGIVSILSRFYPPKSFYGKTWDGNSTVFVKGKEVVCKKFDCETFQELVKHVELFYTEIENKCLSALNER